MLLFQFHDVLPGSAIGLVYEHTAAAYPRLLADLRGLRSTALGALVAHQGRLERPAEEEQQEQELAAGDIGGAQLIDLGSPRRAAAEGKAEVEVEVEAVAGGPWVFNSLHVARDEVVEVPAQLVPAGVPPPQLGSPLGEQRR